MSFRITPNDVGRIGLTRDGRNVPVFKRHISGVNVGRWPYEYEHSIFGWVTVMDNGCCAADSGGDIIAWADEPATDQDRHKDLRDEFAMVALASMVPSEGYRLAHKDTQSTVDEMAVLAYLFADAMMKARDSK